MELCKMRNTGYCRSCDTKLTKGDFVFHTYSFRGQGAHTYLCETCVQLLVGMYDVYLEDEKGG